MSRPELPSASRSIVCGTTNARKVAPGLLGAWPPAARTRRPSTGAARGATGARRRLGEPLRRSAPARRAPLAQRRRRRVVDRAGSRTGLGRYPSRRQAAVMEALNSLAKGRGIPTQCRGRATARSTATRYMSVFGRTRATSVAKATLVDSGPRRFSRKAAASSGEARCRRPAEAAAQRAGNSTDVAHAPRVRFRLCRGGGRVSGRGSPRRRRARRR
jgi:hypothetical protein